MNRINEQLAVGNTLQRKIGEVFRQRVWRPRSLPEPTDGGLRHPCRRVDGLAGQVGRPRYRDRRYLTDVAQRSLIFWDTLRQRGNQFVAHQKAGLPPVLHFDYETILDARTFEQPVNYALLRIVPPKGVKVDATRPTS